MTGWPPALLDAMHVFNAQRAMCPGQKSKVSGGILWMCSGRGTQPGCAQYLHYADGIKPAAEFADGWTCPNYQPNEAKHEANQD